MAFTVSGAVALARWWWTFILRGILAIAFGVIAFLVPALGLAALVGLFAAWALVDGVTSVFAGWRLRGSARSWWLQLLEGVVSIAAGIFALLLPPALVASLLVVIIGAWSIVTGLFEIVMAIRLREEIKGEFWLGLAGVASILFGVVLFLFPAAGVLTVIWLIASFAIVFGVFLIVLGWRLRGIHEMGKLDAAHDYSR